MYVRSFDRSPAHSLPPWIPFSIRKYAFFIPLFSSLLSFSLSLAHVLNTFFHPSVPSFLLSLSLLVVSTHP
ncbi:MAG: hypothetical protein J3R72DRAFT_380419, partial [Linnemannia gamsii]